MPVWKFELPAFTGDAWAAQGDQTPVPDDRIVRVYKRPIRYRASIRASASPDAPVTPDATTIDISVVKVVKSRAYGFGVDEVVSNYQLKSIADNADPPGTEQLLGEFSEFDVDQADQVAIGVRSITPVGASWLWIETGPGLDDAWPTPQQITGEAP